VTLAGVLNQYKLELNQYKLETQAGVVSMTISSMMTIPVAAAVSLTKVGAGDGWSW